MDKKVLRERLDELTKQIKLNSKDAHFAQKLIEDLLSVKGQMGVEVTELDCGKKIDELKGDVFRITLTDRGVLYHEYGGYSIFVRPTYTPPLELEPIYEAEKYADPFPRHGALYETLADMVLNQEKNRALEGEAKENMELLMTAVGWVLQAPKIALADAELTMEIATKVIRFINEQYEKLSNQPLQEETVAEDEQFKDATLAMEALKEEAKKDE